MKTNNSISNININIIIINNKINNKKTSNNTKKCISI